MKYAQIIIPVALNGSFTYIVPDSLCSIAEQGSSVVVNFGKSKLYTGIISGFTEHPDSQLKLKEILSCSSKPVTNMAQMELWNWVAQYYCCSIGEVMKAALPAGIRPDSESRYIKNDTFSDYHSLPEKQRIVLNYLSPEKPKGIQEIIRNTGIRNPIPDLNKLAERGAVQCVQFLSGVYKPLYRKFISLNFISAEQAHSVLDSLKRAPKQAQMLAFLIEQAGEEYGSFQAELSEVLTSTGLDAQTVIALSKKNIISFVLKETSRFQQTENTSLLKELSAVQLNCLKEIKAVFNENKVCLLHGVNSSGKTEIYLHLIDETVRNNHTALYLLPEIAITTQIVHRIKSVFGNIVGVYHSKYSDSERVEVWKKIQDGQLKVIIGVRSSVFLPLLNPGIVIVDEEHENTYKQSDNSPRYNARDIAVVMAEKCGAKVLLASATPSVESYFNAISGKYGLALLSTRYGNVEMPRIVIVDTLQARKRKSMQLHFHPLLIEEVKGALHKSEQVILFQNRRGFSPYIECNECGWVATCKNCNVSLTFHKRRQQMLCHYCGYSTGLVRNCPDCQSTSIKTMGFGTEMVESEARIFFPEARIERLDYDSVSTRAKYEKLIADFENRDIDILIGTQMISKGLDFDNVSIVGILNADNMLNFPDFRAFERSYQLMSQVSGRAGRREKRGKVIIQTSMPEHDVIKYVVEGNYDGFARHELTERNTYRYPPFYRFINLKIRHRNYSTLNSAAISLKNTLEQLLPNRVQGPHEPIVNKVQKWFIMNVIIRFEAGISVRKTKDFILSSIEAIKKHPEYKGVDISIDVDPL
ncbi:MAG: primosomal protein N' [Bacteroidales bacterium]|nr:primosomal protein N' [Bacteroidales bacterium]